MQNTALPFSLQPLDPYLVGPKPIEYAPDSVFEEIEVRGDLMIERKFNGYNTLVPVTGRSKPQVAFYSSHINDVTPKFPALEDEVRSINIPADTLLVSEMLAQVKGADSPELYASIIKSKQAKAIALQKVHPVKLALFNVLVHKGKSVAHLPYGDRFDIIQNLLAKHQGPHVSTVEVLDMPFAQAVSLSRKNKWEGLVLYDRRAGSEYRIGKRAQAPRPEGCWKRKDYKEGDFVAMSYIPSTAPSHPGAVESIIFGQYDEHSVLQEWVNCGIGINEKQRRELANPALYPNKMVFELIFERRSKNHRLILAKIKRQRDDKKPYECIEPKDWKQQL